MKVLLAWVGLVVGIVIGAATGVTALLYIFAVVCAFIGIAIGGNIDEEVNQRRIREEHERQKAREKNEQEDKRRRRNEALALARKYPEATKKYFKDYFGLSKTYISDYDITDDKVDRLLTHSEYEYQKIEEEHRLKTEKRRKEVEEAKRLKEERRIAAEKHKNIKDEINKKEEVHTYIQSKEEREIQKYRENFRDLSAENIEKTIYDSGVPYTTICLMLNSLSEEKRRLVTELHERKQEEKRLAREEEKKKQRIKGYINKFKGLTSEQIELLIYKPSNTSAIQEEMLSALTRKQQDEIKKANETRVQKERREQRSLAKYRKLFKTLSIDEIERTIYSEGVESSELPLMLKSLPEDRKSEVINLHHKKNQEKLEAQKEQEKKNKLKKYKDLFESKTANEIVTYVYNKKFSEKKREEMLSVLSPQRRGAVTRARNIIIFREQEEKRLAEEAERKRLAEEAERKRLAEEAERKRLAEEAERRRLAQEAERRRLAQEAERKRLAEEAERKRLAQEAERRRKEQEIQELNNLKDKISHWPNLSYWGESLPYNYIINYFPTTSSIEATGSEWQDRRLIWNFKNDPNKTKNHEHEKALDNIIPRIAEKLKQNFGDIYLRKLTLVCIPASSNTKNIARFKEFSERLCNMMGMSNAFNRIFILNEREATHDGGEYSKNYSLDSEYFKDRYVIIFDDLITRGRSMIVMKRDLEKCGAKVICGFSVGKTKHNRD